MNICFFPPPGHHRFRRIDSMGGTGFIPKNVPLSVFFFSALNLTPIPDLWRDAFRKAHGLKREIVDWMGRPPLCITPPRVWNYICGIFIGICFVSLAGFQTFALKCANVTFEHFRHRI